MSKRIIFTLTSLGLLNCATAYTYRLGWEKSPMTLDDFRLDYAEGADGQLTQCSLTYSGSQPVYVNRVKAENDYFRWQGESGYMCKNQVMPLKCSKTAKGLSATIPNYQQIIIEFKKKPEYQCPVTPK